MTKETLVVNIEGTRIKKKDYFRYISIFRGFALMYVRHDSNVTEVSFMYLPLLREYTIVLNYLNGRSETIYTCFNRRELRGFIEGSLCMYTKAYNRAALNKQDNSSRANYLRHIDVTVNYKGKH